jgi:hypothetical protein
MNNTDRFSSQEEPEFNPTAYGYGEAARMDGLSIDSNPYQRDTWAWKSFRAGWSDADMNAKEDADA